MSTKNWELPTFTIANVAANNNLTAKEARKRLRAFTGKAPASIHHREWVWNKSAWKAINAAVS